MFQRAILITLTKPWPDPYFLTNKAKGVQVLLKLIARKHIGNRPGRIELRTIKRRP